MAYILEGKLPKPDAACMVALEKEFRRVWPYVNTYIRPALKRLGVPFTAIPRAKYATKDYFGGAAGVSPLPPVYTNQSGSVSKLEEWCSGEWKREVSKRWAAEQPGWKERGVDQWVGISMDERKRRRAPRALWIQPVYPLLDWHPSYVSGCLAAVERQGWPPPPRSRCSFCPNQSDAEWADLTPDEWEAACETDEMIRATDPHAFLHKSCQPLRIVTLNPKDDNGGLLGGCQSGMCF